MRSWPWPTGSLTSSGNQHDRADQFTVRFDHLITNSQKFTAYYYFDDDHRTDPFSNFQASGATLPGFGAIFKTRDQQWNLSHTWTIGSTAVNEFRFIISANRKATSITRSTLSALCSSPAWIYRRRIALLIPPIPRLELQPIFQDESGFPLLTFPVAS